jgi:hypothetical protein
MLTAGQHAQGLIMEQRDRVSDSVDHATNRRPVIHEIRVSYSNSNNTNNVSDEAINSIPRVHPKWLKYPAILKRDFFVSMPVVIGPVDNSIHHPHVDLRWNVFENLLGLTFMVMILGGAVVGCAALGYLCLLGDETPTGVTRYGRLTSIVLAVMHASLLVGCLLHFSFQKQDEEQDDASLPLCFEDGEGADIEPEPALSLGQHDNETTTIPENSKHELV